jgi:hypothetical protein
MASAGALPDFTGIRVCAQIGETTGPYKTVFFCFPDGRLSAVTAEPRPDRAARCTHTKTYEVPVAPWCCDYCEVLAVENYATAHETCYECGINRCGACGGAPPAAAPAAAPQSRQTDTQICDESMRHPRRVHAPRATSVRGAVLGARRMGARTLRALRSLVLFSP